MNTVKLKQVIPFIILFLLLSMLGRELFSATPKQAEGALVGETVPYFALKTFMGSPSVLTPKSMRGKVVLLNFWASWCGACAMEHKMLLRIQSQYHIPIYGVSYRDDPINAKEYLISHGNPYVAVASDQNGSLGVDFGIYGTPETYVIANGRIIYRQMGVIDQYTWDQKIYPLIQKYL